MNIELIIFIAIVVLQLLYQLYKKFYKEDELLTNEPSSLNNASERTSNQRDTESEKTNDSLDFESLFRPTPSTAAPPQHPKAQKVVVVGDDYNTLVQKSTTSNRLKEKKASQSITISSKSMSEIEQPSLGGNNKVNETLTVARSSNKPDVLSSIHSKQWRRAIILSEILGNPKF